MRRNVFWIILGFVFSGAYASAQPLRPLEHEDYDRWNTVAGSSISENGNWIAFTIRDGKNKATLKLQNVESTKQYSIENGAGLRIAYDSKHVAYRVTPDQELLEKLKKQKKPRSEMPQEKFEILNLETGNTIGFENVALFAFPEENGDWIAIQLKSPKKSEHAKATQLDGSEIYEVTESGLARPKKESSKSNSSAKVKKGTEAKAKNTSTEKDAKKEQDQKKKDKTSGTMLIIKHLGSEIEYRIPYVTSFRFDRMGKGLAFATSNKDDEAADGVGYFDLQRGHQTKLISSAGHYRNLSFNENGTQLAFLSDCDDYQSENSSWSLYHWRTGTSKARMIVGPSDKAVPENWWLAANGAPFFSENGRYLFYYTAPKPEDTNSEDQQEKDPVAKLDVWHWQDPTLQPQQLLEAEAERKRTYLAAFNLRTRSAVQLATKEVPQVAVDRRRDSELALGFSNVKYKKMMSWDLPGLIDVYRINLRNGKSDLLLEKSRSRPQLSVDGKYIIWWDTESRNWFSMSTKPGAKAVNMTQSIDFPLYNELHDTPSEPRAYGVAGWAKDDRSVLIYDRFDIWQLDPRGEDQPVCLTASHGRDQKLRFRVIRLDPEERYIDLDQFYLSAFNETTKDSGFYIHQAAVEGEADRPNNTPKRLIMLPEQLSGIRKAGQSNQVIFTRSTYRRFPDIWTSDLQFKTIKRISDANPQQREYAWGTAELTHWKASDGQKLSGLLYKPEDFDPTQKYPLLVYFYERNSDNLHRHYVPAAGRSIINFSFYTSRGYVLFVPDIPYKTGEPGPSAVNSVLPGVQHVVDMGFVDEDKIGMQGHSWGGYQTAYLVTQTDKFACAESGAPVSNMTSAYGGIRWRSGRSRMFQYEKTQSRIGDTLWNAREKYIANSPLFFVDKIDTPLLILHNDQDGAVPWYQGIELFVALRRLEKPAWLLNYNGDPHWVMGRENRLDFAKRMQQFFDHYLQDGPLPKWMAEGIPAVDKGKEFGFEDSEETTESKQKKNKSQIRGTPNLKL